MPATDAAPSAPARRPAGFVALLVLSMGVGSFATSALSVLAPYITDDLNLSRTELGLLFSGLFVVATVAAPPIGSVVDRVGGDRVLVGLFGTQALAMMLVAAAPAYGWLMAGLAVAGMPMAAMNPATNQLVSRHVPVEQQALVMGVKQSGGQVNWVLAGTLLPATAAAYGWRAAMLIGGVLSALGLWLTHRVRSGLDGNIAAVPTDAPVSASRHVDNAAVVWLAAYAFVMTIGVASVTSYLPLYAFESVGVSPAQAGLLSAALGLPGVVARIVWGRWAAALASPARALAVLAAGSIVAQGMIVLSGRWGVWLLWVGAVSFGATAGAWAAVAMLAVLRAAHDGAAGRASGRMLIGGHSALVVAPVLFGSVVDANGGSYGVAWAIVMALFAAGMVLAMTMPQTDPRH